MSVKRGDGMVETRLTHSEPSPPAMGLEQASIDGNSCSLLIVSPPRHLKVLQLQLQVPQTAALAAGRVGYSIRQVQVLGPADHAA